MRTNNKPIHLPLLAKAATIEPVAQVLRTYVQAPCNNVFGETKERALNILPPQEVAAMMAGVHHKKPQGLFDLKIMLTAYILAKGPNAELEDAVENLVQAYNALYDATDPEYLSDDDEAVSSALERYLIGVDDNFTPPAYMHWPPDPVALARVRAEFARVAEMLRQACDAAVAQEASRTVTMSTGTPKVSVH